MPSPQLTWTDELLKGDKGDPGSSTLDVTLDATSAPVVAGDAVCSANTSIGSWTKAVAAALVNAGASVAIVLVGGSGGQTITISRPGELVPASTFGAALAGPSPCVVALNTASARPYRLTAADGSETILGVADKQGNLTVAPVVRVATAPAHGHNVKLFGASADWNPTTTPQGTDNTAFILAAIAASAASGLPVELPPGQFYCSSTIGIYADDEHAQQINVCLRGMSNEANGNNLRTSIVCGPPSLSGTGASITALGGSSGTIATVSGLTGVTSAHAGTLLALGFAATDVATVAKLTADFQMPASGATVAVTVDSTASLSVNEEIYVRSAGHMQVTAIADATHCTLKNLGDSGNRPAGAWIMTNHKIRAWSNVCATIGNNAIGTIVSVPSPGTATVDLKGINPSLLAAGDAHNGTIAWRQLPTGFELHSAGARVKGITFRVAGNSYIGKLVDVTKASGTNAAACTDDRFEGVTLTGRDTSWNGHAAIGACIGDYVSGSVVQNCENMLFDDHCTFYGFDLAAIDIGNSSFNSENHVIRGGVISGHREFASTSGHGIYLACKFGIRCMGGSFKTDGLVFEDVVTDFNPAGGGENLTIVGGYHEGSLQLISRGDEDLSGGPGASASPLGVTIVGGTWGTGEAGNPAMPAIVWAWAGTLNVQSCSFGSNGYDATFSIQINGNAIFDGCTFPNENPFTGRGFDSSGVVTFRHCQVTNNDGSFSPLHGTINYGASAVVVTEDRKTIKTLRGVSTNGTSTTPYTVPTFVLSNEMHVFNGNPSVPMNVLFPATLGTAYEVVNATTTLMPIIVQAVGGTKRWIVPPGGSVTFRCDGTDYWPTSRPRITSTWKPTDTGACFAWYRGDMVAALPYAGAATWKDLTSNANDLAQATGGSQGTARSDLLDRQGLQFTAAQWMANTAIASGPDLSQPWSAFIVHRFDALTDGAVISLRNGASGEAVLQMGSHAVGSHDYEIMLQGSVRGGLLPQPTLGAMHLVEMHYAGNGNGITIALDGVETAWTGVNVNAGSMSQLIVNARTTGPTEQTAQSIAELFLLSRQATSAERTLARIAAMARYSGLSVAV